MNAPWRVVLAVVLLAGCGREGSADADPRPAADSTASAGVDAGEAGPAAATPAVVLAPDGLAITGGAAPRQIAFGAPQASVLAEAGTVLGAPREQGVQEECPAGPLHHAAFGAVQLAFQDGAFVGWAAETPSPLRTAEGVGPGSTLAQVRAAYPAATVDETSLGTEFTAGELYGVFADSTAEAPLEHLFAGINCIFR